MRRRTVIWLGASLFAGGLGLLFLWQIPRLAVAAHQRGVTRSLANWASEYSRIGSVNEARRTVEMIEYIESYYVVGEGYRSFLKAEAALEAQRKATLRELGSALEKVTGLDFGTNLAAWKHWLATNSLANRPNTFNQ